MSRRTAVLFSVSSLASATAAVLAACDAGPVAVLAALVVAMARLGAGIMARRRERPGRHRGVFRGGER